MEEINRLEDEAGCRVRDWLSWSAHPHDSISMRDGVVEKSCCRAVMNKRRGEELNRIGVNDVVRVTASKESLQRQTQASLSSLINLKSP